MLLEVKNLTVNYGTVQALDSISFKIDVKEIVALIGPNGAGKSTSLKAICGLLKETNGEIKDGEILFEEESIKKIQTYELVRKGICLVPEGRRIFSTMTVYENLEMGFYTQLYKKNKSVFSERVENIFNLFPILKTRRKQKSGTLSGGEQQMLAIGRSLMLNPKLLLFDEPSLGLSPNYVEDVFERIKEINEQGITVLLVEQNARKALEYSDRAYVFGIGKIELSGNCKELSRNDEVKRLFLQG